MTEYTKQVAETIQQQLYAGGKMVVWSWGVRGWSAGETAVGNSFLAFRVSGFIFKGIVKVILFGNDTYTVQLIKNKKGVEVIEKEVEGIYADNITEVIDGMVEKAPNESEANYENKVKKATYNL